MKLFWIGFFCGIGMSLLLFSLCVLIGCFVIKRRRGNAPLAQGGVPYRIPKRKETGSEVDRFLEQMRF